MSIDGTEADRAWKEGSMRRLESKPQGAQFTGRIEPEGGSVYAYYRDAVHEYVQIVTGLRESWWRLETPSLAEMAA